HRVGGRPIHVVGHSRGAHVALELACLAPQLVQSLVLADPGFRPADRSGQSLLAGHTSEFLHEAVELLQANEVDLALTLFIDTVNGEGTWRQMVSWFKTMVRDNAYTLLSQVNEVDTLIDIDRVRAIDCPVLLLGGENSPARYAKVLDKLE